MGYGVKVEVWGDYALFSRPELKTERVSYDVITPRQQGYTGCHSVASWNAMDD